MDGEARLGRRVRKRTYAWTGSAWSGTAAKDERYVYDEWNVIMVLNGLSDNVVTRQYTWGPDLSGTLHGAGGIGGLLAAYETYETSSTSDDKSYWYFYDARGNVNQVVEANGTTFPFVARYGYDPYGNMTGSAGSYVATNPFCFSTKWFDTQTGLYYYGYRYYSPRMGRWLSRDWMGEEEDESHSYAFVSNAPQALVDTLGKTAWSAGASGSSAQPPPSSGPSPGTRPSCCDCRGAQNPNNGKWPYCCRLIDLICQHDPQYQGRDCAASKCKCLQGQTEATPNPCHADTIFDPYCWFFAGDKKGDAKCKNIQKPPAGSHPPYWLFLMCDDPILGMWKGCNGGCESTCTSHCNKWYDPGPQRASCYSGCRRDCKLKMFPNGESPGCCCASSSAPH